MENKEESKTGGIINSATCLDEMTRETSSVQSIRFRKSIYLD